MRHYVYKIGGNVMYIIDTKQNENYFIILKDNKEYMRIGKKTNTLETVKKFIGSKNIKEVI